MPLSLKLPKFLDLVAVVQSIFLKQQEPQGPVGPAIDQFPPSSSISQVNFIPRNILAFRLITKTLARIASTHPFTAIDNLSDTNTGWQSSERHEVKVSDAFAHLAVAEHDIVAISTNYRTYFRSLEAKDPKTDSTLGVMACSTPDNVENLDTTTSSGIMPYGQGILAAATKAIKFKVLASKNDQNTDPKNLVPIIIKPVRPGDFGDGSLNDYMKDLETNWREPSLPSHLWILGQLLASRDDSYDFQHKRLYKYVISVCCRKMNRRLRTPHSQSYLRALRQVKESTFQPIEQPTDMDADPKSQRKLKECINSDYEFLHTLLGLTNGASESVLFLPRLPNIIEAAKNVHSADQAAGLYNKVTCIEFHLLLLDLLKRFGEALSFMSAAIDNLSNLKKGGQASFDPIAFKHELDKARIYGYLLTRLARGRALQMHVESIESALAKCIHTDRLKTPAGPLGDDSNPTEVDAMEMDDVEDVETILRNHGSLWKAFVAWLRLIVVHFDAVEILVRFVNDPVQFPFRNISIKMLVGPTTSHDVLPWTDLLKDSTLFPETDVLDTASDTKSNADIARFLGEAIKKATYDTACHNLATKAKKNWDNKCGVAARDCIISLNKVASLPKPAVLSTIHTALQKSNWKTNPQAIVTITDGMITLCNEYKTPATGSEFYLSLAKPDSFNGKLHCEAFMAFLLDHATYGTDSNGEKWVQELKEYGPVIGVSKQCCPTCFRLLHLLSRSRSERAQPFLVRGSHSTISACTLPPWTASAIVDQMNATFGGTLRRDLIALMSPPSGVRRRTISEVSQPLSVDSTGLGSNKQAGQSFTSITLPPAH